MSEKINRTKKLKSYQKIFLLILVFSFLTYLNRNVLIYRNVINYTDNKQTKAVIIDEKEGLRRSHLTGAFTYYYEFNINDKSYKNPSYNESYKIGDSVNVIYCQKFPFINKIIDK